MTTITAVLCAVIAAETVLMVLACLALIVWGLWPEPQEQPVEGVEVPLEVLAGWHRAESTTRPDDLQEAA